jgi:ElaB/YqjD/DUF883 family membrane-anchored ribosome-binding protein
MNESNDTAALRSDIDVTRRRMDDTMDAIGNRLQGRHLVDEILGLFRRNDASGSRTREKLARSVENAGRSVATTVKENPVPTLLIGAGVAWLIYSQTKSRRDDGASGRATEHFDGDADYDPDLYADRPLQYPSESDVSASSTAEPAEAGVGEKLQDAKDTIKAKASAATAKVKDKLASAGAQAKEKVAHARERLGEFGEEVSDRARDVYVRSREQVAATVDEHPLEVGLGCLAAGLMLGLLLPTPDPVNRVAGPAVDRLRRRARDTGNELLEKTKHVASAATSAARDEARAQGLTGDDSRNGSSAPAEMEVGNPSGSVSPNPS